MALKASKEIINNLQEKYYANPPASRNSFTYGLPSYYCRLLEELDPEFDFKFDEAQTFPLYSQISKETPYCQALFDKIFEHCQKRPELELLYL